MNTTLKELRRKSRKVTDFGKDLQDLIVTMNKIRETEQGVGLAANQIGVMKRVIVVKENEDSKLYVLINPEITRMSRETTVEEEGCLSVPEFTSVVERAKLITIKGQNRFGQDMKLKVKDDLARVFQHEVDHINGILFMDRSYNNGTTMEI